MFFNNISRITTNKTNFKFIKTNTSLMLLVFSSLYHPNKKAYLPFKYELVGVFSPLPQITIKVVASV
ncbi:hypothetical protein [Spiroplasma endosymbiont of Polydrusus pterygomalis]|uniref:hypothetical protein n=1 Tax=Spiroplasma endosymbiont of Polydrusus pterygomalis TaxID=3139327 RepID=UPI003CCB130D